MNEKELFKNIKQASSFDELVNSVVEKTRDKTQHKINDIIEQVLKCIVKYGFYPYLPTDMYTYHEEGDIINILQHKITGKWIFIISKFYLNDSKTSIDEYDVEKILTVVNRQPDKYKEYDIYLIRANNKKKLKLLDVSNIQVFSVNNFEDYFQNFKVKLDNEPVFYSFNKIEYLEFIGNKIRDILLRPSKDVITYDILDNDKSRGYKLAAIKLKQIQMKYGEIWQVVLGNYNGCIDLKTGHASGLDILSISKNFAIELKNRTNTDNSSSRETNLVKLVRFKKLNPTFICIYASINEDTREKTTKGSIKKIIHNNIEIEHLIGYKFLNFILGDDTEIIIDFVKNTIDKYIK